jgi:hypothetical protein
MVQATGKGQVVGASGLPADSTAITAISEALNQLNEVTIALEGHATRLAGSPPQEAVATGAYTSRPYEDGQMAGIEDQLLSILGTLRYANERLSAVTQ